ncbi:uncharacterized protein LOC114535753 [Dendronephthya gigantea]|uniref:uncharacterized protein LOC114535753 n=1 Tax=Dendronephthya gigantea TaxID=151771 RepID=UPI00106B2907|nr:uncharacterized protein LOC114535753 [Dendronephthya gigantea]
MANHVIETKQAEFEFECGLLCARHGSCASINYKTSGIGKGRCELNNKTNEDDDDEEINFEYNHLVIIKPIWLKPEKNILPGEQQNTFPQSCTELFVKNTSLLNGAYTLQKNNSSPPYKVYCHMTDIPGCGVGGWTLVMKLDGTKNTFNYRSSLWTNKETYAVQDGLEGLTEKESKLASYWNTPFTKICLGMTFNGTRKWMSFNYTATSLYSVIADGQFRATGAGRAAWKSLIAGSSLQLNCNREGFNTVFRIRIGFQANNENDCDTCDSWIGYGARFTRLTEWTCGNVARLNPDNGDKNLATFGYILVQ